MSGKRASDKQTDAVLWQDEIRNGNSDQLINVLKEIRDSQCAMKRRVDSIETGMTDQLCRHIELAFAGGDPEGHRRAHQEMIDMLVERRKMYANLKEKTLSGLLWGVVVWVVYAILTRIKIDLGLPP